MARIPMGNFGNAMPEVDRIQMPQRNTGQLAQAAKNLGDSLYARAEQKDKHITPQHHRSAKLHVTIPTLNVTRQNVTTPTPNNT